MNDRVAAVTPRARAPHTVRVALWIVGWALHALLLALAQEGLRPVLGGHPRVLVMVAGALVVVGLAWLVPEAPWWLWSAHTGPHARAPGRRAFALACLLRRDARARKGALGDALRLHGALQAPALGVALALPLRGLAWALPALGVLCAPWVARRLRTRVEGALGEHAIALEALADDRLELPRRTRWVLRGVALTSAAMLGVMCLLVTQPAPARLDGACPPSAWATRLALPGPIAGTPLRASLAARTLTLVTEDGGGPGGVALARGPRMGREGDVRWAWVEAHRTSVRVTLCAENVAAAAGHVVLLAPEGYRLDDDVAARVLRGHGSSWCALLVLLLLVVLGAVGRPALLDASAPAAGGASQARATPTVLLAMTLSVTQLTWVGLVLLDR